MTTASHVDPRLIEVGPSHWCWTRLGSADEGILSFWMPRGRVTLAVPYSVADTIADGPEIIIGLAPINTTGWQAVDQQVALEITGADHENLRWLVRATGIAHRAAPDEPEPSLGESTVARRWLTPTVPPGQLLVSSPRVHGFYETLAPDAYQPRHPITQTAGSRAAPH